MSASSEKSNNNGQKSLPLVQSGVNGDFVNEPHQGTSAASGNMKPTARTPYGAPRNDEDATTTLPPPRALVRQASGDDDEGDEPDRRQQPPQNANHTSPKPSSIVATWVDPTSTSKKSSSPTKNVVHKCAVAETISSVQQFVQQTVSSVHSFVTGSFHGDPTRQKDGLSSIVSCLKQQKSCMKGCPGGSVSDNNNNNKNASSSTPTSAVGIGGGSGNNGCGSSSDAGICRKSVRFQCKGDKFFDTTANGAAAAPSSSSSSPSTTIVSHHHNGSQPSIVILPAPTANVVATSGYDVTKRSKPFSFLQMFMCPNAHNQQQRCSSASGHCCEDERSTNEHQQHENSDHSSFRHHGECPTAGAAASKNGLSASSSSSNNSSGGLLMVMDRSDSCAVDSFTPSSDDKIGRLENEEDYERVCMENESLFALQQLVELYKRELEKIRSDIIWNPLKGGAPTESQIENTSVFMFRKMTAVAVQQFRLIFPTGVSHLNASAAAQRVYGFLMIELALPDDDMLSIAVPMLPGVRLCAENCPPEKRPWFFAMLSFKSTRPNFVSDPEKLADLRRRAARIGEPDSCRDDQLVFDDPISWSISALRYVCRIQCCLPHFVRRQESFYNDLLKVEKQIKITPTSLDEMKHPIIQHQHVFSSSSSPPSLSSSSASASSSSQQRNAPSSIPPSPHTFSRSRTVSGSGATFATRNLQTPVAATIAAATTSVAEQIGTSNNNNNTSSSNNNNDATGAVFVPSASNENSPGSRAHASNRDSKNGMSSLACLIRRTPKPSRSNSSGKNSSSHNNNNNGNNNNNNNNYHNGNESSTPLIIATTDALEDGNATSDDDLGNEQRLVVVDDDGEQRHQQIRPDLSDLGVIATTELALHGKIDDVLSRQTSVATSTDMSSNGTTSIPKQMSNSSLTGSLSDEGGRSSSASSFHADTNRLISTFSGSNDNAILASSSFTSSPVSSSAIESQRKQQQQQQRQQNQENQNSSSSSTTTQTTGIKAASADAPSNSLASPLGGNKKKSTIAKSSSASSSSSSKKEPEEEMLLLVTREKIGSGATGDVYSATCTNTGRLLALKEMHIRDVARHGAARHADPGRGMNQLHRDKLRQQQQQQHVLPSPMKHQSAGLDGERPSGGDINSHNNNNIDNNNNGKSKNILTEFASDEKLSTQHEHLELQDEKDRQIQQYQLQQGNEQRNTMSARFSELNRSFSDASSYLSSSSSSTSSSSSSSSSEGDSSDNRGSEFDENTSGLDTDYYTAEQISPGAPPTSSIKNGSGSVMSEVNDEDNNNKNKNNSNTNHDSASPGSTSFDALGEGAQLELIGKQQASSSAPPSSSLLSPTLANNNNNNNNNNRTTKSKARDNKMVGTVENGVDGFLGGNTQSANMLTISRDVEAEFRRRNVTGCGECDVCMKEKTLLMEQSATRQSSRSEQKDEASMIKAVAGDQQEQQQLQQQNEALENGSFSSNMQNGSNEQASHSNHANNNSNNQNLHDQAHAHHQNHAHHHHHVHHHHHHHHANQLPMITEEEQRIVDEISTLKRLRHENIISYYGARWDRSRGIVYIAMELANRSLRQLIERMQVNLPLRLIAVYARGILQGLAYLHENHIIHRDIKAANILVTDSGVIKVSDFGLSVCVDIDESVGDPGQVADEGSSSSAAAALYPTSSSTASPHSQQQQQQQARYTKAQWKRLRQMCGTPQFLSVELFSGALPSEQSDIWSFGCTMIELVTGHSPWWNYESNTLWEIFARLKRGEAPRLPLQTRSDITPEFKDFVESCLQFDPLKRPSARELLEHPFLNTLHRNNSNDGGDFQSA